MNYKKAGIFGGILFVGVMGIIALVMSFYYPNKEIDLRTQTEAQQKKCEAYFDKMWKIIKQEAGVTEQYKDAFMEIYPKLIEGRYSQGDGSLMKWITESNPEFKTSLYEKLMQSIEIERTGFFNEQTRLIDINREHSALLQKKPSRWFISSDKKPIKIIVVTSSATDKAYATGKEDDVELFNK
jgi:hypothetical protein